MAKSGPKPKTGAQGTKDAEGTRRALIAAAVEALRDCGFAQASAREIGRRADCNQALVFYHFGSVVNLHLAALDHVSEQRRARYQAAVQGASGDLSALLRTARTVVTEDLDQGNVAVLATMIAAAQSIPELGPQVAERIAPWRQFAADSLREAIEGVPFAGLLPADDLAHGVVALYLGLEMLASLDGDREPASRLFDHADRVAARLPRLPAGRRARARLQRRAARNPASQEGR